MVQSAEPRVTKQGAEREKRGRAGGEEEAQREEREMNVRREGEEDEGWSREVSVREREERGDG